jgi:hypothetical protein
MMQSVVGARALRRIDLIVHQHCPHPATISTDLYPFGSVVYDAFMLAFGSHLFACFVELSADALVRRLSSEQKKWVHILEPKVWDNESEAQKGEAAT